MAHAKALLLVDDEKSQILKCQILRQQLVGADKQVHPALFHPLQNFLHLLGAAEAGEHLVASHSNDAFDRPLSTYSYGSARYIKISGVRFEVPDVYLPDCFERFISGEGI